LLAGFFMRFLGIGLSGCRINLCVLIRRQNIRIGFFLDRGHLRHRRSQRWVLFINAVLRRSQR
jgi:hypothetical protein